MSQKKRILLADDEVIFLKATSNILRENDYICDCATDAESAMEMLRSNDYDLLISDIKMPGNSNMELISNISKIAEGMPVILVTAYPSIDNTIRALRFHVSDYMLKPVDLGELLKQVSNVLKSASIYHEAAQAVQKSIIKWKLDLENNESLINKVSKGGSFNSCLDVLFRNMFDTLMNLRKMTVTTAMEDDEQPLCNLHGCVNLGMLKDALVETVATLKKTKNAFKSKELGVLRAKLESLLAETSKNLPLDRWPDNTSNSTIKQIKSLKK